MVSRQHATPFVEFLEPRRHFDAGAFDAQFNARSGGAAITDFRNVSELGQVVLPMADGRVVVAGGYRTDGEVADDWDGYVLVRHSADGSFDPTFGAGGAVKAHGPAGLDIRVNDAVLLHDGSILVVGSGTRTPTSRTGVVLARFTASGELDGSFGTGGIIENDLLDLTDEGGRGVVLLSDGKVLVAGVVYSRLKDRTQLGVMRLNADGTMDETFGDAGRALAPAQARRFQATALLLNADGTAVVVGQSREADAVVMAKFDDEGGRVSDFGTDGVARHEAAWGEAYRATLALDGGIVTAGRDLDQEVMRVAKFDADGRRVLAFGNDGVHDGRIDIEFDGASIARGVALQSDGKLVVAGSVERSFPTDGEFAIARLNPDGTLDNTWGQGGRTAAALSDSTLDGALDVAIGPDGSIYAAGTSQSLVEDFLSGRLAVARFWRSESPSAFVAPRTITRSGATGQTFSVVYRDDGFVDAALFDNADITITGPDGATYRARFVGQVAQLGGAVRIVNYRLAAPGGSFDAADNGVYRIKLNSNQIGDTQGNLTIGRTLGRLTVRVPQSPFPVVQRLADAPIGREVTSPADQGGAEELVIL